MMAMLTTLEGNLFTVIVFLFVVVLPYILVPVFVHSLQAKSEWKILSWVNKLKPLFDAYTGPCWDKYCFWTGFFLQPCLGG